jgi:hypothetical protein
MNTLRLIKLIQNATAHSSLFDFSEILSVPNILVIYLVLKLKQLTVLTLAETAKVLPYDLLMQ